MVIANEERLRQSVKITRTPRDKGWQTTIKLAVYDEGTVGLNDLCWRSYWLAAVRGRCCTFRAVPRDGPPACKGGASTSLTRSYPGQASLGTPASDRESR